MLGDADKVGNRDQYVRGEVSKEACRSCCTGLHRELTNEMAMKPGSTPQMM